MSPLLYVTTNPDKFQQASLHLGSQGITLMQEHLEMEEIQTLDGELIVRDKARQAFAKFGQPVLVNDDTWSIPALRGFPSTGMKMCEQFFQPQDWLRLMAGVEDRRIFLISYFAYYDGTTMTVFTSTSELHFLQEARGEHPKASCLKVISPDGSGRSVAEMLAAGEKVSTKSEEFWTELATFLTQQLDSQSM